MVRANHRVAGSLESWPARDGPALSGVSAFELGGTNAHLVVRECPNGCLRAAWTMATPTSWRSAVFSGFFLFDEWAADQDAFELARTLRDLNGTPQELLDNDELMALILPTFRADLSVLENYRYRDEPPLEVPITVFGGTSDPFVPPSALAGWRRQSTGGSRLQLFPGDHFFVNSAATDVMGAIARDLR